MDALTNHIFTFVLTNDTITLQEVAKQIYLKNVGDELIVWTGDKRNVNEASTAVSLGVAEDFEFEPNGAGYKAILIDASASASTSVEITAIY